MFAPLPTSTKYRPPQGLDWRSESGMAWFTLPELTYSSCILLPTFGFPQRALQNHQKVVVTFVGGRADPSLGHQKPISRRIGPPKEKQHPEWNPTRLEPRPTTAVWTRLGILGVPFSLNMAVVGRQFTLLLIVV